MARKNNFLSPTQCHGCFIDRLFLSIVLQQKNISTNPKQQRPMHQSASQWAKQDQEHEQNQSPIDQFNKKPFYQFQFQLQLPKSDPKTNPNVLSVYPALKMTFLLQMSFRKLQYYSSTGILLKQFNFQQIIVSMAMLSNRVVLIFLRSMLEDEKDQTGCRIVEVDLQNYDEFWFDFHEEFSRICPIEIFQKTNQFCIIEQNTEGLSKALNRPTDNIKISYFKYPLHKHNPQLQARPTHQTYFSSKEKKSLQAIKLDNIGKIGLIHKNLQNCKGYFHIFIHSPFDAAKGKKYQWNQYVFDYAKNGFNVDTLVYKLETDNVWEMEPDALYLRFSMTPKDCGLIKELPQAEQELRAMKKMCSFYWPYKKPQKKKFSLKNTLIPNSQSHIYFLGQPTKITLKKQLPFYIKRYRIKRAKQIIEQQDENLRQRDYEFYREWCEKQGKLQHIPIYYVDGTRRTVVGCQLRMFEVYEAWRDSCATDCKIRSVGYDWRRFVEFWQVFGEQDSQKLAIKIKILKQLDDKPTIVITHLLTQCVQECDEDLLYYVTCLTQYNQNDLAFHQAP